MKYDPIQFLKLIGWAIFFMYAVCSILSGLIINTYCQMNFDKCYETGIGFFRLK